MHLGDAELVPDLALGHLAEEPQQQDAALAVGQRGQQRSKRFAVLDVIELRLGPGQGGAEPQVSAGLPVVAGRLVEGGAAGGLLRPEDFDHHLDIQSGRLGDLTGAGGAAVPLREPGG